MMRDETNITAWGTVMTAVAVAAVAFPQIAKSAEKQRLEAESEARFEALLAFGESDSKTNMDYWLDSKETAISYPVSASTIELSQNLHDAKEAHCLAEAVYYEARSETKSGQRAVAEVILNRVKNKHFPDTVCGVVYEGSERSTGCQFTFTCDGSMEKAPRGKAWDRSVKVAEFMLSGGHTPITNKATHYHTVEVNPAWSNTMRMTRQVGTHVFYRFAPRDYRPSEPAILVAPPI